MSFQRPPGPKGHFFWGSLRDFRPDQPGYLSQLVQEYGDLVFLWLLYFPVYLLGSPDYVREVLVNQAEKFEKAPLDRQILGKFLGNGLLTSEGTFWRRQRKLAQPAFHAKRIQAYAGVMTQYTEKMLAGWQSGETRDIDTEMMRLTMFIVSKTLFNADAITTAGNTAEKIGQAVTDLQHVSNNDYQRGMSLPDWLPTADNRKRRHATALFNQFMEKIIAERRTNQPGGQLEDKGDLLSMLMVAQDEEGQQMSDRQLRDEVATLFAAGHETTANALTWTFYLLSQHPSVEARLHQELDTVLAGRTPTLADLANLPYTQMVVKEALRLYPPAWILNGRIALENVEIGIYTIPKGSTVFISPYVMHRLPQYFPDPDKFMPERFTPETEKTWPKMAYMPFGGGPRVCIGNAFAMMEAPLLLATIAQQFQLRLQPGHEVKMASLITLTPQNGMPMRLESRRQVIRPFVPAMKSPVAAETAEAIPH